MSEPRPASTVMCLRESLAGFDVYLLRRSAKAAFMPDVYVYPGGAVDDGDRALTERLVGSVHVDVEPRSVVAAIRESFEECGLFFGCDSRGGPLVVPHDALASARAELLAGTQSFGEIVREFAAYLDASALVYFSRWVTPALESRRFDARFFIARAPSDQIAEADASETHDGRWIAPDDALAEYAAGRLALMFPTIKHLERLAAFSTIDDALRFARTKSIVTVMPDVFDGPRFVMPAELEGRW